MHISLFLSRKNWFILKWVICPTADNSEDTQMFIQKSKHPSPPCPTCPILFRRYWPSLFQFYVYSAYFNVFILRSIAPSKQDHHHDYHHYHLLWDCSWVFPLLLLLSCFSRVQLCASPETAAYHAPPSLGFSRQEHWSGLPFPSPVHESEKWKWSRPVVSDSSRLHGLQPTRLLRPWDFPGKSPGVGCHCLLQSLSPRIFC